MVTKTTTEAIDIPTMDHVNLYTDDIDLPQIKPRTLINRNEFYIMIEKLPGFEDGITREEAKKAIGKSVYTDWLQNQGTYLHKQLKEKKDILKKTEQELLSLKRPHHQGHGRRSGPSRFDQGPDGGGSRTPYSQGSRGDRESNYSSGRHSARRSDLEYDGRRRGGDYEKGQGRGNRKKNA